MSAPRERWTGRFKGAQSLHLHALPGAREWRSNISHRDSSLRLVMLDTAILGLDKGATAAAITAAATAANDLLQAGQGSHLAVNHQVAVLAQCRSKMLQLRWGYRVVEVFWSPAPPHPLPWSIPCA